jgi:hypothetical protein
VSRLGAMLAGAGGEPTLVEVVPVTAVTAGAAKDGSTLVEVLWRGSLITARYLDTYTSPLVGDDVLLVHHADTPTIVGRVTGEPVLGATTSATPRSTRPAPSASSRCSTPCPAA